MLKTLNFNLLTQILFANVIFTAVVSLFLLFWLKILANYFLPNVILRISKITAILQCLFLVLLCINMFEFFQLLNVKVIVTNNVLFKLSYPALFIQIVIASLMLLTYIVFFYNYSNVETFSAEIDFLISAMAVGAFLLVMSNGFLTAYMAIELQAIPLYALIASKGFNIKASEISLKYFILSALASSLFLFGFALIYFLFGISSFDDCSLIFNEGGQFITYLCERRAIFKLVLQLAIVAIFTSIFFKLAAAPFHYWLVDIYENAPLIVILVFNILQKLPLVFLLSTFTLAVFDGKSVVAFWYNLSNFVALSSILVGTAGAYFNTKFSSILAFGSVSHMGFIIIAASHISPFSWFVTLAYTVNYLITTLLIFAVWFNIKTANNSELFLSHFIGIKDKSKPAAVFITVAFLSFAGLPPLGGFITKLLVLVEMVNVDEVVFAFVVFMASMVSAAYYLRLVKVIWFDKILEPNESKSTIFVSKYLINVAMLLLSLLVIIPWSIFLVVGWYI